MIKDKNDWLNNQAEKVSGICVSPKPLNLGSCKRANWLCS